MNDKNDTTGGSTGTTWIYAYDRGGNILSKTAYAYTTEEVGTAVRTYTYGYTDTNWKDKLTSFDNSTITYDGIGNPLSDGTWTYVWQAGRQLKSMTKVDGNDTIAVEFTYNHAGLRTKKTKKVNGTVTEVTEYILNGKNVVELIHTAYPENSDPVVNVLHFYYDAQGRAAMVKHNGVMYGYVHDLQGDVIGILDNTGSVAVEFKYDAWGRPLSVTGTLAATLGELNPFRYRGYVFDQETQLYYLRSRYYNSIYHRFHNSDIEYDGNIFIYCNNNPCIYYDPTGKFTEEDYKYDWAGLAILLHWLTGNGKEYVVSDGRWRDYLNSAPLCTEKGCDFPEMPLSMYMLSLYRDIGSTVGEGQSYNDSGSFHLSFKNGEGIIGYNYLHGSNENYGGFSYTVNITQNYGYRVYSFIFNFNDRIDPNYKYATDAAKAEFANSLPFVNPTDYTIRITWGFEYVDFINGTSH